MSHTGVYGVGSRASARSSVSLSSRAGVIGALIDRAAFA
jgi:hypothetical protein